MAESHLVSGLKTLRGEQAGELAHIREEIARLEREPLTLVRQDASSIFDLEPRGQNDYFN